jgi:hypothetical protein
MKAAIDKRCPVRLGDGIRRGLRLFLALFYLIACLTYQVSCVDRVTSAFGLELVSDASRDGGSVPQLALCDHCPTCSLAVVPAAVSASVTSDTFRLAETFVGPFAAADHAWLVFPPPKHLT